MRKENLKLAVRLLLACLFVVAGVLHFTHTGFYLAIMPTYLPFHLALVLVSGFFEIVGGTGLLVRVHARRAAYGLVLLLVAVFPANVNMALNDAPDGGTSLPPVLLWLRLPLQFVLIALVLWCTKTVRAGRSGVGVANATT